MTGSNFFTLRVYMVIISIIMGTGLQEQSITGLFTMQFKVNFKKFLSQVHSEEYRKNDKV